MNYSYKNSRVGVIFGALLGLSLPFLSFAGSMTVATGQASNIGNVSATLNGNYDTNGNPGGADVRFEWGATPSLGNSTTFQTKASNAGAFSATITGLSPNTQYFFRAMVNNQTAGPAYGAVIPFTTTGTSTPSVITTGDTHTSTSATLSGFYNGNGSATTDTQFLWGTSSSTLNRSTGFVSQASASGSFSETISGLTPGTRYYYRAVAKNSMGTVYASQTLTFVTDPIAQNSCVINNFSANPTGVSSGSSTILSWTTSGCTSTSISGIGTVTPTAGGSTSSGPIGTSQNFTLTATGTNNTDTKTLTVTVTGTGGSTCVINSFYATPSVIVSGASSTLSWQTSGCTNLSISGIGSVQASGSQSTGSLTASTTYTLSGQGTVGGFNSSQLQITVNGTGNGTGSGSQYCVIHSFTAAPNSVSNGQSSTLSWQTSGCSSVSIQGGTLNGTMPSSYSLTTGPLSGTTTYTLYANGNNSTTQSITIYVTGGPYSYIYACSDNVDNDADGLVDYPADPGCYSAYDNDETGGLTYTSSYSSNPGIPTSGGNVITTAASNVGNSSARLNGIVTNSTFQTYVYFEYGRTTSLGNSTPTQFLGGGLAVNFYDTIQAEPNATYFYRAVSQDGNIVSRGSINSFTTTTNGTVVYAGGSNSTSSSSSSTSTKNSSSSSSSSSLFGSSSGTFKNGSANANGVYLSLSNGKDGVSYGDKLQYTINYANQSQTLLKDVILSIVLPQGFTATQATEGKRVSMNTVEVDIGTLAPGAQGSVYLEATVDQNAPRNETLVTTANLAYTLPGNIHDSTVAYVLNHVTGSGTLGGFALGAGFFPTTIFGWLLTILIILAIILFARRIVRNKRASHSGGHH